MVDPKLQEAMRPTTSTKVGTAKKTSPLDQSLEASIKEHVDKLMDEEHPSANNMIPPQVRRQKLENEVREELDLTDFGVHLSKAFKILKTESTRYLAKEEDDALRTSLDSLLKELQNLDPSHLKYDGLKNILQMPPEIRASIYKIGMDKFNENLLDDSLSIFTFLTLLDADDPNYWYHFGLAAQQMGRYDLALRAYSAVIELAPEFIEVRFFSVQCHLHIKEREVAEAELAEIKNIIKTTGSEEKWNDYVIGIENTLANPHSR